MIGAEADDGQGGLDRVPLFSAGFDDPVGPDAVRADAKPLAPAIDERAHSLQVGVPPAGPLIVGMADMVAKHRSLTANLTHACHDRT